MNQNPERAIKSIRKKSYSSLYKNKPHGTISSIGQESSQCNFNPVCTRKNAVRGCGQQKERSDSESGEVKGGEQNGHGIINLKTSLLS